MAIELIDDYFPLLIMNFGSATGDMDVSDICAFLQRFLDAEKRYSVLVHGAIGANGGTAIQRQRVAKWQNANAHAIRRCNVGTALVIESALFRGAITALGWISSPPYEQKALATFSEGIQWCVDRLTAAGVPIRPALQHFYEEMQRGRVVEGSRINRLAR